MSIFKTKADMNLYVRSCEHVNEFRILVVRIFLHFIVNCTAVTWAHFQFHNFVAMLYWNNFVSKRYQQSLSQQCNIQGFYFKLEKRSMKANLQNSCEPRKLKSFPCNWEAMKYINKAKILSPHPQILPLSHFTLCRSLLL